jgi:hypothetical protein
MASTMVLNSQPKPEMVQLTQCVAARIPRGSSWMAFDVDSVASSCSHPGARVVRVRDYRYGADPAGLLGLGRNYQVWSLRPGEYEKV